MNPRYRKASIVSALFGCAVGLTVLPGSCQLRNLSRTFTAEAHRERDLRASLTSTDEQIAVKDALVDEMVAGRLTLAQVAETCHKMIEDREDHLFVLRIRFPEGSDRERVARSVVQYALRRYNDPGSLCERLDAELFAMYPATRPAPAPIDPMAKAQATEPMAKAPPVRGKATPTNARLAP